MAPALEPLFQNLSDDVAKGNYKKAIEVCEKILEIAPKDNDALLYKCLSLIQLGQFEEALAFINATQSESFAPNEQKAYCLYKAKSYQEAITLLDSLPSSTAVHHLLGQIYYRIEKYDKALAEFEKEYQSEPSDELLVNIFAVKAAKCNGKVNLAEIQQYSEQISKSYELAYNVGCLLVKSGDLVNGDKYLSQAEEFCNRSLNEQEYSQQEIEEELAPIKAQRGYIYQLTNKNDEAFEIYDKVIRSKAADAGVSAIVHNNMISVKGNQKLFNAEKNLYNAVTSSAADIKLTTDQKRTISFNRAVVYLKMGKNEKCQEVIDQFRQEHPNSPLPGLLQSALLFKEKKIEEAEQQLKGAASDFTARLSLAQIFLRDGKLEESLAVLNDLGEVSFRPAVVATRVKLYEQLHQLENAHLAIDSAVTHWSDKGDERILVEILAAAAEFKYQKAAHKQAADYYSKLLTLDKSNQKVYIPKLVIALSYIDPAAAATYAENLPEIPRVDDIDVEKLENFGANRSAPKDSATTEELSDTPVQRKKNKNKKKKKKRLPKNYDPTVAPDPERWLPRRQRSSFKKRRGKMRGGHQGGDASDNKPTTATPTAVKQTPVPAATRPQQKKGKQKPKKKGKR